MAEESVAQTYVEAPNQQGGWQSQGTVGRVCTERV